MDILSLFDLFTNTDELFNSRNLELPENEQRMVINNVRCITNAMKNIDTLKEDPILSLPLMEHGLSLIDSPRPIYKQKHIPSELHPLSFDPPAKLYMIKDLPELSHTDMKLFTPISSDKSHNPEIHTPKSKHKKHIHTLEPENHHPVKSVHSSKPRKYRFKKRKRGKQLFEIITVPADTNRKYCINENDVNDPPLAHKCNLCRCSFSTHYASRMHKVLHTSEEYFKCGGCEYFSDTLRNVKSHIRKKHKKK